MNYDPIEELNRENERRALRTLWAVPAIVFAILCLITLVVRFGPDIDRFVMAHQLTTGYTLIVGSLVGIVRWVWVTMW